MDKFDFRYAEGKWTIKEIIQHVIDTERILVIEHYVFRNDKTPLPGFDENEYVINTDANDRHLQSLLTELSLVRQCTIALLKFFSDAIRASRVASNNDISVVVLGGFILIGHQNIIKKYL
jgi:hypothetical protein